MSAGSSNSRRDFLTGKALQSRGAAGQNFASQPVRQAPMAGDTIRLGKPAMACDFDVILNPEGSEYLAAASAALDLIDRLEDQMTVYRTTSELSAINARAAVEEVTVEPQLFELLQRAARISRDTEGAFDPTSGPLVALWRRGKHEGRIPSAAEVEAAREFVGIEHVRFDDARSSIRYDRPGVELNLGSIGKGYALDRAGDLLREAGLEDWLLHGGHSSILCTGWHAGREGWPVGIRNPLFPERRVATLLLRGQGFSTSGSGVQFFRHEGRRYGHILDPRTGWPAEGMLSVSVLAPTAAEADALSTAFFVLGVEKSREYCNNHSEVAALIIPPASQGRRLEPINCGIPDEVLYYAPDDLSLAET